MDALKKILAFLLLNTAFHAVAFAAEGGSGDPVNLENPDAPEAVTTGNPYIHVDALDLMLMPLTQSELEIEANAWLKILQQKVAEISTAEIAAKIKREELQLADDLQAAIDAVENAKQVVDEKPDDTEAANALADAILNAKNISKEKKRVTKLAEQDESLKEVIAVATKQAEERAAAAAENGDEEESEEDDAAATDTPDTQPADETDRKIQQAKKAIAEEAAARTKIRSDILEYINSLRAERTELVDRANVAIAAWEAKGGQVEEFRQYVSVVSATQVDLSDAQATWATIYGWFLSDEGGIHWLKNISVFLFTIFAFMFLSRISGKAVKKVFAKTNKTSQLLEDFMVVTVKRLVLAVGVLVALTTLQINVGPLLAVVGAAGFVIAFALQNSLGNFASGILVLLFRPFDVGDLVEIGGILGEVRSVNLLSVQITTPDNKLVIVPNNNVWSGSITNVTGTNTRRIDLIFGISYDDDIDKAQNIMQEIVDAHELVLKDPEPVIQVHELADSSVNFVCRPWVKTTDYWTVYWDLTKAVKQRFDKEGISIHYPQQDVHHYNTAVATVPATAAVPGKSAAAGQLHDEAGGSESE
jgi:small conductance mechanosensitive channel